MTKFLEIVPSYLCGPMKTTSMGDARYFVTFINDFLKMMYLYALKSKRECFEKFKEFKVFVELQLEHKSRQFSQTTVGSTFLRHLSGFFRITTLRSKRPPHIGLNKTDWKNIHIVPSWR